MGTSFRSVTVATITLVMSWLFAARPAMAFSIESVAGRGCHERITRDAGRRSGWPTTITAASPLDRALAAAVPFAPGDADPMTLALLIGVRDNDTGGATPADLPELAAIHNGPHQEEHCLRRLEDDGAEGESQALAACHDFILSEVSLALGEGEVVDLSTTEFVKVGLWTGSRNVAISRYAFHLGRALHAVQDSFAHASRAGDDQVATLFNYVEPSLQSYREERDGPPHLSSWDACDSEVNKARVEAATNVSAQLMTVLAIPGTRAERLARADQVITKLLAPAPDCETANAWCNTLPLTSGCSQTSGLPLVLVALLSLSVRRRGALRALSMPVLVIALVSSTSYASESDAGFSRNVHLVAGGSVDRGAGAFGLGFGVDVSERWALSFDGEFSPWFDVLTARSSLGTARLYATVHFAWLKAGPISLRTSAEVGGSVLLASVPGATSGAVGVVVGLSLVGLRWQATPHLLVEVIPDVLLDVPSLHGVPYVYRQYRLVARVGWAF